MASLAQALVYALDPVAFAIDVLGFIPDPWQREALRWAGKRLLMLCARQTGKALHVNTPLPTPGGWTSMGEVCPGDYVLNEQGLPCLVKWCSPVLWRQTYRVGFSDGSTLIADGEHLWTTLDLLARRAISRTVGEVPQQWPTWKGEGRPVARDRRSGEDPCGYSGCGKRAVAKGLCGAHYQQAHKGQALRPLRHPCPGAQTRTTLEMMETLTKGTRLETNHAIPATASLDLQPVLLPVEPYLLGVWLGDGTSATGAITCALADREILDQIEAGGYVVRTRNVTATTALFVVAGLHRTLRVAGLLNNKHIPPCYLRASASQRLALLRGLMDSDGYTDRDTNSCEFTTTSECLATGFYELATSLGIIAVVKEGRATLYGRDIGPKWRISFNPPFVPFRLRRKADLIDLGGPRKTLRRLRYVTSVDPNGQAPVRCIAVNSPTELYLAGKAMIPTHNSTTSAVLGLHTAVYYPGSLVLLVSRSLRQSGELFRKVSGFMGALEQQLRLLEDNKLACQLENGSRIVSLPGTEATVRGFSAPDLVIEDEAARVGDELHAAIRPMLAVSAGKLILMSTPFGKRGHFWTAWDEGGERWKRIKVTAEECPRISAEFLAEERESMPAFWFDQEYQCNPPEAPIWMGDFSFQPLGQVRIGDTVIGWHIPESPPNRQGFPSGVPSPRFRKRYLTRAKVVAIGRREADIAEVQMASGNTLYCTPDHKWLSMPGSKVECFTPAVVGQNIARIINPTAPLPARLRWDAAWLGGMYDGEGSGNHIAQSASHNPAIHERLKQVIQSLGFRPGTHTEGFYVTGGKQALVDFLNWTQPTRQDKYITRVILGAHFRHSDRVASVRPAGRSEVVSLQTTTGNYVAWGYASKNCQFLEDESAVFRYDDILAMLETDEPPLFGDNEP